METVANMSCKDWNKSPITDGAYQFYTNQKHTWIEHIKIIKTIMISRLMKKSKRAQKRLGRKGDSWGTAQGTAMSI